MTGEASAVLEESTIADCAGYTGGAVFGVQANVTVKGGRFERCTAARGGGILAFKGDVALLEGSVISECHAERFGGALHAERVHTVATLDASCAADLPYPSRAEASEARGCRA